MIKLLKPKSCKQCKQLFTPKKLLQRTCGFDCALAYTLVLKVKNDKAQRVKSRKENKEKLNKLKTKSEWLKDAQVEFNKFIRLRDAESVCISCGRYHSGQYHAGHYRSVGSAGHLRFNELNVHKQCSACNNHLSGNIINYRINLIYKIGLAQVENIESDNTPKHYTIDEIKEIKTKYRNLCKHLKENQKDAA